MNQAQDPSQARASSSPTSGLEKHLAFAREFTLCHPEHPMGWKALGAALLQAKRPEEALLALQKALDLDPGEVEALNYHGLALKSLGRREQALQVYAKLLALMPGHASALNNQGTILHDLGLREQALDSFVQALKIRPDFDLALNNQGNVLKDLGQLPQALDSYTQAIKISPGYAIAHNNRGSALRDLGRLDQALASCQKALDLDPGLASAHNNLGNILLDLNRLEPARASYARALELKPDYPAALNNQGTVLKLLGRLDQAMASFIKALELKPDFPEALNNLATLLKDIGHWDQALNCWARALSLKPDFSEALNNLASALGAYGRFEDALNCYVQALNLTPNQAEIRTNYALTLLASGNFAAGWPEYEHRLRTRRVKKPSHSCPAPRWPGQAKAGQTVLIRAEQGLGDTLQFCRYAPTLADMGLRVALEVQPPVLRLLGSLAGVSQLLAQGQPLPACDFQIPLMSVPGVLGTNWDNIPSAPGYLRAEKAEIAVWKQKLALLEPSCPRVGLVWSGGLHDYSHETIMTDRRRSISLETLAPLLDVPGVRFVCLQKDKVQPLTGYPLFDPMDDCHDFADTAALVMNLDLVISVDTAVAHLGGALGRPVWLLNRFDSCWRWQRGMETTPWYASLRIFHQKSLGDWPGVVEMVARALADFAQAWQGTSG